MKIKKPRLTNAWGEPTGFAFLLMIVGFVFAFVFLVSWAGSEDRPYRTDIPGTNCEVVEKDINNFWLTPGEDKTISKIVCTTKVDKIDISR